MWFLTSLFFFKINHLHYTVTGTRIFICRIIKRINFPIQAHIRQDAFVKEYIFLQITLSYIFRVFLNWLLQDFLSKLLFKLNQVHNYRTSKSCPKMIRLGIGRFVLTITQPSEGLYLQSRNLSYFCHFAFHCIRASTSVRCKVQKWTLMASLQLNLYDTDLSFPYLSQY